MYKQFASVLLALLVLSGCATSPEVRRGGAGGAGVSTELDAAYKEGLVLMRSRHYEEALRQFESISQKAPELAGPHINTGIALARLDRDAEAEKAFRRALALRPDDPVALNQLGLAQRRQGRFEEARRSYMGALSSHPDYANAHLNLGILCDLYLQNMDCAIEHYTRYQSLASGENRDVALWLADLDRRRKTTKE